MESEDPKAPVAQVCIFEDYEKPGKKPKNSVTILLEGALTSYSGSTGFSLGFSLVSKDGKAHEFCTETENDQFRWVSVLKLLIMLPKASIPQEPTINPIKSRLWRMLEETKKYGPSK